MKSLKRLLAMILTVLCLAGSMSVVAASPTDYVLEGGKKRPIPDTYVHVRTISFGATTGEDLNNPQDLFVAENGDIYVADTGNNRILILDNYGNCKKIIKEADGKEFLNPRGIFVDSQYHMFISDSSNARIVHLDKDGNFIEEFVKPDAEYLESVELYTPTKVIFGDNTGFLYTIMGKELLTMDANNNFKGYFAANKLGFSLKNLFIRVFASDEQKKRMRKDEADAFTNIHYQNNRIYAVTAGTRNNVQVINSVGNNIFPAGTYGEYEIDEETGLLEQPLLVDAAASQNGIVTVAQENNSKIYQYDMDGHLLAAFGGYGKSAGYFELISSIAMDKEDRIYVLDVGQKNIQILEPTRFISLLHEANELYDKGKYDKALVALEEVRGFVPAYKIVREKIGDIYYKQDKYEEAMDEFRNAEVLTKYGEAFEKDRYELTNRYFLLVAFALLLIIVVAIIAVRKAKELADVAENKLYYSELSKTKSILWLFPLVLFHPVRAFEIIKRKRKYIGIWPVFALLGLTCAMRILQIYAVNYTVADTTPENASLLVETGIIVIPVLAFATLCYLVTSLMTGECTFKEILLDCSYSLAPAIVLLPILTAVSWAVGATEAVFYQLAVMAMLAWVCILIILAVGCSNQYGFWKTIGVVILTIVAIILVAALILLFFSLAVYVVDSVKDVFDEARSLKLIN